MSSHSADRIHSVGLFHSLESLVFGTTTSFDPCPSPHKYLGTLVMADLLQIEDWVQSRYLIMWVILPYIE